MPLITTSNGTELFYDLTGPDGAPVIAFSNPIGTTLEMWDAQARALAGRHRVLRYDTRGHGRSPTLDRSASIADLANDLAGVLDALGMATAHVVGLSLGGMTAQSLAARRPDRVESLTLMATSAYLPGNWEERAATVRAQGMGAIADAVIARWFTPGFAASAPEQVAPFRDRFLRIEPRGYAACCDAIADMDLRSSNAAITAPTLIIAGTDDPATPVAMMEEIRARIPQAELIVLPRAAHLLAVERADLVTRHLAAFLDSHSRAGGVPSRKGGSGVSLESGLVNRPELMTQGASRVLGTWRLRSYVREVIATGQRFNQFGDDPDGYLGYAPDGRMYAIFTRRDRVTPRDAVPTDEEGVQLLGSMVAYAGRYTVSETENRVVHHIDISWNQAWTGTDQLRFFELDGDTLTITTAPYKSYYDGREGRSILVWTKARSLDATLATVPD